MAAWLQSGPGPRGDQRRPLAAERVDLVALAADAVESAQAIAADRRPALEVATAAPLDVLGDEHRLRQVVANLVANAITHTPAGADVTVRLSRRPDTAGAAVLEVTDTAGALTPQQAQRVFERFYRADPARTHTGIASGSGSGLGLSIVAAIVAAHGGAVELDTVPGRSTTFRVILPAHPDAQPPAAAAAQDHVAPAPA